MKGKLIAECCAWHIQASDLLNDIVHVIVRKGVVVTPTVLPPLKRVINGADLKIQVSDW